MRNPHHSKKFFIIINRREGGAQADPQPCCLLCGRMVAMQKRSQVVTKAVWHDAPHRLAPPGLDASHPVSLKNCDKQLETRLRFCHNKQGKRFCGKIYHGLQGFYFKKFRDNSLFFYQCEKIILGIQNLKFQYLYINQSVERIPGKQAQSHHYQLFNKTNKIQHKIVYHFYQVYDPMQPKNKES